MWLPLVERSKKLVGRRASRVTHTRSFSKFYHLIGATFPPSDEIPLLEGAGQSEVGSSGARQCPPATDSGPTAARDQFVDLLALIGSGADDCLFPVEVARILGLKLDPANAHVYGGIGEGEITAIFGTVTLEVGGWAFSLYAGFSDAPSVIPILGQNGFFNLFEVRFNLGKEVVELKQMKGKGA